MTEPLNTTSAPSSMRFWLPLVLGIVFALGLLEYARTHIITLIGSAAFGAETARFDKNQPKKSQCADASDSAQCIASWRAAGSPPAVLWFGNSQLEGINRYKRGDVNAPELLRRDLAARGLYSISYSQPNANLTEQSLLWNSIGPAYRPKLLILPICYDDIRELGVRDTVGDLLDSPATTARIEAQSYWPLIAGPLNDSLKLATKTTQGEGHKSLQSIVEAKATGFLTNHWTLWEARPAFRGTLGFAVHIMRNQVLGIHSTSKRPVDAKVYADRMALLDQLVAQARREGTDVLLYAPPYRQDIDGPYPMDQYRQFKRDLQALAQRNGAGFADIDNVVPGPEWATVTDELFGFKEPDFMHFTAAGHKRLAAGVDAAVRRMGY